MSLSIGTTDAALCSAALVLLGNLGIDSLTQETDKARKCAAIYTPTINDLMGRYGWKFSKAKRQLARDTTAPISEWTYQYGLPSDRLNENNLELFPTSNVGENPLTEFEIHGNRVLTNAAEVWADYQVKVAESEWPSHFQQLVIYALAAALAIPVTDSTTKAGYWQGIAFGTPSEDGMGGYFRVARRIDSSSQPSQKFQRFSLIDARG